ncbi:MAG: hypothetical protein PHF67_04695 [Candidatus Nanoarchaeia archaeon]|nr:hypothetical protein [Candidatus Nanoarchaeia archaeon]
MAQPNPADTILQALEKVEKPEQKAKALFDLLKPRGAEQKPTLPLYSVCRWQGDTRFADTAPHLLELAFRNQEMGLGVRAATKFGLADQLYERVIEASQARGDDRLKRISELPGANKERWKYQQYDHEPNNWFNQLQVHIAREYLLASGRLYEAADLLLTAGQDTEAFQIATTHLQPEQVLQLAETHQTGFAYALAAARKKEKKSLESHVQAAHVESLVNGKNRDLRNHDRHRRISIALQLAQQYELGKPRQKQILEEGVKTLIDEREARFSEREKQEYAYAEKYRYGRERYDECKPKDPRDEHRNEYAARVKDLSRVRDEDRELIELLKMLPDDERTPHQTRFLEVCKAYNDSVSALHVATGLKLWGQAFETSARLAHYDRYGYSGHGNHEYRNSVRAFVDDNLFQHLDDEQAKVYLRQISWTHDPDASLRVAKKRNLGEWLTAELIKESQTPFAARLQKGLGDTVRAIQLYEQAECFSAAAGLSTDNVEKSRLRLLAVDKEYVQSKRFEPFSTDYVDWHGIRRRATEILEALNLAEGHRTDPRYVGVVRRLVGNFSRHGDYDLAILLAKDSELEDIENLLPASLVESAVSQGNFTGAYALSKARGDARAEAYAVLAESLKPKSGTLYEYSSFRDLFPKPSRSQGKDTDPCVVDEVPF